MKKTEIKSLINPKIKHLIKLKENKKYRYLNKTCFVFGNKIILELLNKKKYIKTLFTTDEKYLNLFDDTILISSQIMQKLTNSKSCEPLAAEVFMPKILKKITKEKKLLLLDHLQDPGNIGTLIRTAHGLFLDGIIFTNNCTDPFNDKAIRAAKGSTFSIPFFYLNKDDILKTVNETKITPYLADIKGENVKKTTPPSSYIIILSNETHGPSNWPIDIIKKISIPMKQGIDSLNVAISGAILIYHFANR